MTTGNGSIAGGSFDVVIVGAGPAGTSAAWFLAEHGLTVAVLDRARFPRDKVCGDGISPMSLSVLDRMGVAPAVEAAGSWRIDGISVRAPNGATLQNRTGTVHSSGRSHGLVVPRSRFDHVLVEHVRGHRRVRVVEGFAVQEILEQGGLARGVRGSDGVTFLGKVLIGADGVHSVVARGLGLEASDSAHRACGMRAYFDDVQDVDRFLRIDYEDGMLPGYTWLFPTGPRSANVGIITFDRYQPPKQTRHWFERQVRGDGRLAASLCGARMVPASIKGGVLALGSARHARGRHNAILIGDAGSFVDPMAGEGIYYALRTGELAAEVVAAAIAAGTENDLAKAWARSWRRDLEWVDYRAGTCVRSMLRCRPLFNLGASVLERSPDRTDTVLGVLGHALPKSRLLGAVLGRGGNRRYAALSSPSSALK